MKAINLNSNFDKDVFIRLCHHPYALVLYLTLIFDIEGGESEFPIYQCSYQDLYQWQDHQIKAAIKCLRKHEIIERTVTGGKLGTGGAHKYRWVNKGGYENA